MINSYGTEAYILNSLSPASHPAVPQAFSITYAQENYIENHENLKATITDLVLIKYENDLTFPSQ